MHLYRYDLINKMYRLRREPCEHDVVHTFIAWSPKLSEQCFPNVVFRGISRTIFFITENIFWETSYFQTLVFQITHIPKVLIYRYSLNFNDLINICRLRNPL